jgi:hypothetical protein
MTHQITIELTEEQAAKFPFLPVEVIPVPPEGSHITNPRFVSVHGSTAVIEYELTEGVEI